MEEVKEGKRIHHGHNVRLARTWKNITQEALADKLNIYQTDVSTLEQKETIDDKMLDKIAKAMNVPLDFFTNFDLGSTMNSYNVNNNETYEMTQTNSDTASGNDFVQQKIVEREEIIYNPLDKVTELYERLLKEKEQLIERLEKQIEKLNVSTLEKQ